MTKLFLALAVVAVASSGCGPPTMYLQPGHPAFWQCQMQAEMAANVAGGGAVNQEIARARMQQACELSVIQAR